VVFGAGPAPSLLQKKKRGNKGALAAQKSKKEMCEKGGGRQKTERSGNKRKCPFEARKKRRKAKLGGGTTQGGIKNVEGREEIKTHKKLRT